MCNLLLYKIIKKYSNTDNVDLKTFCKKKKKVYHIYNLLRIVMEVVNLLKFLCEMKTYFQRQIFT